MLGPSSHCHLPFWGAQPYGDESLAQPHLSVPCSPSPAPLGGWRQGPWVGQEDRQTRSALLSLLPSAPTFPQETGVRTDGDGNNISVPWSLPPDWAPVKLRPTPGPLSPIINP